MIAKGSIRMMFWRVAALFPSFKHLLLANGGPYTRQDKTWHTTKV